MRVDHLSVNQPVRQVQSAALEGEQIKVNTHENANRSEAKPEQKPISENDIIEAVDKANRAFTGVDRRFEISVHKETNTIMVKVINSQTDEVIREIPSKKLLDMVAKMWEIAGIIVDKRI